MKHEVKAGSETTMAENVAIDADHVAIKVAIDVAIEAAVYAGNKMIAFWEENNYNRVYLFVNAEFVERGR